MDKSVLNDLNTFLDVIIKTDCKLNSLHYVYALKCLDNTIYVGKTQSPLRRILEHYEGKTGGNRNIRHTSLIYLESFNTHLECARAELKLMKILNRDQYDTTVGTKKKRKIYNKDTRQYE